MVASWREWRAGVLDAEQESDLITGMLTVDSVVPGGVSDGFLQPGDVLVRAPPFAPACAESRTAPSSLLMVKHHACVHLSDLCSPRQHVAKAGSVYVEQLRSESLDLCRCV